MKIEVKYALISTVALIVWVITEHLLGFNTTKMEVGQYTQPIIAIVVLVILFFGIRENEISSLKENLLFYKV